jgi:hypothetical protein
MSHGRDLRPERRRDDNKPWGENRQPDRRHRRLIVTLGAAVAEAVIAAAAALVGLVVGFFVH